MNIGALWIKESEAGKKYMSGIIKYPGVEIPVVIFKVEDKKSDNSPDYQIIWSHPKKKNENNNQSPMSDDSEIPF